ncbi:MAG: Stp1/IreP family PP2C-type Ser/Thr phosphatase [Firmicutes bacterium]|nr:Stp1/IreP family PP2C-type Ser/Thr phosphatase [Bacillota bacterium]MBQ3112567.1 Stp1/IreP family PP2C-type Ser/Thr phosphatase [Bacillota bacterium]MBQ6841586.1 Stp1/IreP family PP2C-type Ser/Thr phosphatase [Bacillota bacterium]MBR6824136.1 Stp1/IreP family PP2C-type Ser/Thr phosphatase [Bacillota bacterium]MBR7114087.1 Stp1/IreP family PP2C-type Ser/Thr phosphatase [Bacillota bacterium]
MNAEYISHVGAVREKNEDAVFCDKKAGLFAVADGLGGHLAGEVASATAVRILAETFWRTHEEDAALVLREAFYEANSVLHEAGKAAEMAGMGTTMTAAAARGDTLHIAHVGDSRAYIINKQGIRQLTTDHSLVAELVEQGKLTPEEARNHPQRHIIRRSLGQEAFIKVDEITTTWHKGDYLLMCTDGLYAMVDDIDLQELVLRSANIELAARFMAEIAFNRGGYDNISLILAAHD